MLRLLLAKVNWLCHHRLILSLNIREAKTQEQLNIHRLQSDDEITKKYSKLNDTYLTHVNDVFMDLISEGTDFFRLFFSRLTYFTVSR